MRGFGTSTPIAKKLLAGVFKVAQKNLILVLEYVDGGDLERWLTYLLTHGVRLVEEKLIWHLFEQVADSLRYIHERRIIHRGGIHLPN